MEEEILTELLKIAKELLKADEQTEVGDVEEVVPVGSTPVKTRQTRRMHSE
jgi:hypothetical protein